MIRIIYRYNKKNFTRLYVERSHRSVSGKRISFVFCILFFSYLFLKLDEALISIFGGRITYLVKYCIIFQICYVLLVFFSVFYQDYKDANSYWERRELFHKRNTYIQTISFYVDYLVIDCVILHKEVIKKVIYQDICKIKFYKDGMMLSIKGKHTLYICRQEFNSRNDYETVCRWLQTCKKSIEKNEDKKGKEG